MATAFVHETVPLGRDGLSVIVDGNSKITAGNGTYEKPAPNAFSLPAASVSAPGYCPGSTPTCRASCYVKGLAKNAPGVYKAYQHNANALATILATPELALNTAVTLGQWVGEHCPGGFRWHVSGDVQDARHARWIVGVCRASPHARHWIYTRTLDVVPILVTAPNLTVNVSADADNAAAAIACARANGARVAYMATSEAIPTELREDDVIFPDYPLRGRELERPTSAPWWQDTAHHQRVLVCPADFFGQSEQHRCGPCSRCLKPPKVP